MLNDLKAMGKECLAGAAASPSSRGAGCVANMTQGQVTRTLERVDVHKMSNSINSFMRDSAKREFEEQKSNRFHTTYGAK